MKRILIFTLVIVISFHISAAETVLGSSVLPISLNLSEGGVSYIEVGFSYNQISHFSDKVDFAVKEKHNITVKEDGSSSESDDDIYVYWKILSANSVSAETSATIHEMDSCLTGELDLDSYITKMNSNLDILENIV